MQAVATLLQSSAGAILLSGVMAVLQLSRVVTVAILLPAIDAALHHILRQETLTALHHTANNICHSACSFVQQGACFVPAFEHCCRKVQPQLQFCIQQLCEWIQQLSKGAAVFSSMITLPHQLQVSQPCTERCWYEVLGSIASSAG